MPKSVAKEITFWQRRIVLRQKSRNRKMAYRKFANGSYRLKTKGKYTKYRYFPLETTPSLSIISERCQYAKPLFWENNPCKKHKLLPNPYEFLSRLEPVQLIQQEIYEYQRPTEHPFDEGIDVIALLLRLVFAH